jgi:hypothetical protein
MSFPFRPTGSTLTFSVTGSSTAAQAITYEANNDRPQIRVENTGASGIVYIMYGEPGVGAASATVTTELVLGAGKTEVFTMLPNHTSFRMISSVAGPSLVYVTPGDGC